MSKNVGPVVRRYSTALFELAHEANLVGPISEQLSSLLQILTKDTLDVLVNPLIDEMKRKDLLKTVLSGINGDALLEKFLNVLWANCRISALPAISKDFLNRADTHEGICRAEVFSARPMSPQELQEFENSIATALKKKVILTTRLDESLKAGYVVKIGNTVVDASLRARLASLKESLTLSL